MPLTETGRINILMMRGFGDRIRTYEEVAQLFNETFRGNAGFSISTSTVYRTINRFHKTGSIKDKLRSGRPATATKDEKSLEVLQSIVENPHASLHKLSQQNDVTNPQ